jgi:hypothetical protein
MRLDLEDRSKSIGFVMRVRGHLAKLETMRFEAAH